MIEAQFAILIGLGIIEVGLVISILKLKKSLQNATKTFSGVHGDIKRLVGYADTIYKGFSEVNGTAYDVKLKGKTPFGEVNVKIDLERAVME